MTMLDTFDPLAGMDATLATGPNTGALDSWGASWRLTQLLDNSNSADTAREEAWDDIADAVNGHLPPNAKRFVNPVRATWHARDLGTDLMGAPATATAAIFDHIRAARTADPKAFSGLPDSQEKFDAFVFGRVRREAEDLQGRLARSHGALASIASFGGSMAATVTDPLQLMMLPLGASGSSSVMRTALVEAGLGAGSVVAAAPAVAEWRDQVGLDYGAGEFMGNLAAAAGGGAVLGSLFKVAPHVAAALRDADTLSGRALIDRFRRNAPDAPPAAHAAADLLEAAEDTRLSNPMGETPAGLEEHLARSSEALEALGDGRAPAFEDLPTTPVLDAADAFPRPGVARSFKPSELHVDARRFQFKEGGDEFGVLPTLKGATRFDPILAGDLMVWEDRAGKFWVADGHQRSGLAKRAAQAGQEGIELTGHVWREADGIGADDMRLYAAFVNVARGTGSETDMAKVMRAAPQLFEHPAVSATQRGVRQANDLASLSEDGFLMVVNDVVAPDHAALVGRLVQDPELHVPILGLLARAEPENATQAESIVRQALEAGATKETQTTLFGTESNVQLLFKEKARVLDGTLRALRRDKRIFGLLQDEQSRIAGAGNVLAEEVNAARARQADTALQVLVKLAHRKGPLADALNQAARTVKERGLQAAIRDFGDVVTREIEGGALTRVAPERAGKPADAPAQIAQRDGGPQNSGAAHLSSFANPGRGGQLDAARQLLHEAREELALFGDAGDVVPVDALTGETVSTKDLLAAFDRETAAHDHLATCIAGGRA